MKIRIVKLDFYMGPPIPGLDVLYSEFRGSSVHHVPIIRVYGATEEGKKICLHIHGVFPYIYIPYDAQIPAEGFLYQVAWALDKALNVSLGQASSNVQHVYRVCLVSGIPFYGYHARKHQFLKIYFYNPLLIKKASALLQNGNILGKIYQPHEAHIPYILQFMIDYNLHGMSFVHLSDIKYRVGKHNGDIHPENSILPPSVAKMSVCRIEGDAHADHILNLRDVVPGKLTVNPGIKALWDDEQQRRADNEESSPMGRHLTQNRGAEVPPTATHFAFKSVLDEKLKLKTTKDETSTSESNLSVYPAETPLSSDITDASVVDKHHLPGSQSSTDNSSIFEETIVEDLDETILDEDALRMCQLLLEMRKDNVDGDSILSQEVRKEDESDGEGDGDLSLPLNATLTPKKMRHAETWEDSWCSKIPQLDGVPDEKSEDEGSSSRRFYEEETPPIDDDINEKNTLQFEVESPKRILESQVDRTIEDGPEVKPKIKTETIEGMDSNVGSIFRYIDVLPTSRKIPVPKPLRSPNRHKRGRLPNHLGTKRRSAKKTFKVKTATLSPQSRTPPASCPYCIPGKHLSSSCIECYFLKSITSTTTTTTLNLPDDNVTKEQTKTDEEVEERNKTKLKSELDWVIRNICSDLDRKEGKMTPKKRDAIEDDDEIKTTVAPRIGENGEAKVFGKSPLESHRASEPPQRKRRGGKKRERKCTAVKTSETLRHWLKSDSVDNPQNSQGEAPISKKENRIIETSALPLQSNPSPNYEGYPSLPTVLETKAKLPKVVRKYPRKKENEANIVEEAILTCNQNSSKSVVPTPDLRENHKGYPSLSTVLVTKAKLPKVVRKYPGKKEKETNIVEEAILTCNQNSSKSVVPNPDLRENHKGYPSLSTVLVTKAKLPKVVRKYPGKKENEANIVEEAILTCNRNSSKSVVPTPDLRENHKGYPSLSTVLVTKAKLPKVVRKYPGKKEKEANIVEEAILTCNRNSSKSVVPTPDLRENHKGYPNLSTVLVTKAKLPKVFGKWSEKQQNEANMVECMVPTPDLREKDRNQNRQSLIRSNRTVNDVRQSEESRTGNQKISPSNPLLIKTNKVLPTEIAQDIASNSIIHSKQALADVTNHDVSTQGVIQSGQSFVNVEDVGRSKATNHEKEMGKSKVTSHDVNTLGVASNLSQSYQLSSCVEEVANTSNLPPRREGIKGANGVTSIVSSPKFKIKKRKHGIMKKFESVVPTEIVKSVRFDQLISELTSSLPIFEGKIKKKRGRKPRQGRIDTSEPKAGVPTCQSEKSLDMPSLFDLFSPDNGPVGNNQEDDNNNVNVENRNFERTPGESQKSQSSQTMCETNSSVGIVAGSGENEDDLSAEIARISGANRNESGNVISRQATPSRLSIRYSTPNDRYDLRPRVVCAKIDEPLPPKKTKAKRTKAMRRSVSAQTGKRKTGRIGKDRRAAKVIVVDRQLGLNVHRNWDLGPNPRPKLKVISKIDPSRLPNASRFPNTIWSPNITEGECVSSRTGRSSNAVDVISDVLVGGNQRFDVSGIKKGKSVEAIRSRCEGEPQIEANEPKAEMSLSPVEIRGVLVSESKPETSVAYDEIRAVPEPKAETPLRFREIEAIQVSEPKPETSLSDEIRAVLGFGSNSPKPEMVLTSDEIPAVLGFGSNSPKPETSLGSDEIQTMLGFGPETFLMLDDIQTMVGFGPIKSKPETSLSSDQMRAVHVSEPEPETLMSDEIQGMLGFGANKSKPETLSSDETQAVQAFKANEAEPETSLTDEIRGLPMFGPTAPGSETLTDEIRGLSMFESNTPEPETSLSSDEIRAGLTSSELYDEIEGCFFDNKNPEDFTEQTDGACPSINRKRSNRPGTNNRWEIAKSYNKLMEKIGKSLYHLLDSTKTITEGRSISNRLILESLRTNGNYRIRKPPKKVSFLETYRPDSVVYGKSKCQISKLQAEKEEDGRGRNGNTGKPVRRIILAKTGEEKSFLNDNFEIHHTALDSSLKPTETRSSSSFVLTLPCLKSASPTSITPKLTVDASSKSNANCDEGISKIIANSLPSSTKIPPTNAESSSLDSNLHKSNGEISSNGISPATPKTSTIASKSVVAWSDMNPPFTSETSPKTGKRASKNGVNWSDVNPLSTPITTPKAIKIVSKNGVNWSDVNPPYTPITTPKTCGDVSTGNSNLGNSNEQSSRNIATPPFSPAAISQTRKAKNENCLNRYSGEGVSPKVGSLPFSLMETPKIDRSISKDGVSLNRMNPPFASITTPKTCGGVSPDNSNLRHSNVYSSGNGINCRSSLVTPNGRSIQNKSYLPTPRNSMEDVFQNGVSLPLSQTATRQIYKNASENDVSSRVTDISSTIITPESNLNNSNLRNTCESPAGNEIQQRFSSVVTPNGRRTKNQSCLLTPRNSMEDVSQNGVSMPFSQTTARKIPKDASKNDISSREMDLSSTMIIPEFNSTNSNFRNTGESPSQNGIRQRSSSMVTPNSRRPKNKSCLPRQRYSMEDVSQNAVSPPFSQTVITKIPKNASANNITSRRMDLSSTIITPESNSTNSNLRNTCVSLSANGINRRSSLVVTPNGRSIQNQSYLPTPRDSMEDISKNGVSLPLSQTTTTKIPKDASRNDVSSRGMDRSSTIITPASNSNNSNLLNSNEYSSGYNTNVSVSLMRTPKARGETSENYLKKGNSNEGVTSSFSLRETPKACAVESQDGVNSNGTNSSLTSTKAATIRQTLTKTKYLGRTSQSFPSSMETSTMAASEDIISSPLSTDSWDDRGFVDGSSQGESRNFTDETIWFKDGVSAAHAPLRPLSTAMDEINLSCSSTKDIKPRVIVSISYEKLFPVKGVANALMLRLLSVVGNQIDLMEGTSLSSVSIKSLKPQVEASENFVLMGNRTSSTPSLSSRTSTVEDEANFAEGIRQRFASTPVPRAAILGNGVDCKMNKRKTTTSRKFSDFDCTPSNTSALFKASLSPIMPKKSKTLESSDPPIVGPPMEISALFGTAPMESGALFGTNPSLNSELVSEIRRTPLKKFKSNKGKCEMVATILEPPGPPKESSALFGTNPSLNSKLVPETHRSLWKKFKSNKGKDKLAAKILEAPGFPVESSALFGINPSLNSELVSETHRTPWKKFKSNKGKDKMVAKIVEHPGFPVETSALFGINTSPISELVPETHRFLWKKFKSNKGKDKMAAKILEPPGFPVESSALFGINPSLNSELVPETHHTPWKKFKSNKGKDKMAAKILEHPSPSMESSALIGASSSLTSKHVPTPKFHTGKDEMSASQHAMIPFASPSAAIVYMGVASEDKSKPPAIPAGIAEIHRISSKCKLGEGKGITAKDRQLSSNKKRKNKRQPRKAEDRPPSSNKNSENKRQHPITPVNGDKKLKTAPSLGENGTVSCNFETSRSEAHDCRTNIPDSIRSSTNQNASLQNKGIAEDQKPSSNKNRKNKRLRPITPVNGDKKLKPTPSVGENGTVSCNFESSRCEAQGAITNIPDSIRFLTNQNASLRNKGVAEDQQPSSNKNRKNKRGPPITPVNAAPSLGENSTVSCNFVPSSLRKNKRQRPISPVNGDKEFKPTPSVGKNGTVSCNFETSRCEAHDCRTNIPDSIRSSTNQNASLRNKGVAEDRQPSSNENRKNKRGPPITPVNAAPSLGENSTVSCNFVPSSLRKNKRQRLISPVNGDKKLKPTPSVGENGTVSCNFESSRCEAQGASTNIPDSIRFLTNQNASLRNKGVAEHQQPSSNKNRKNKRGPPITPVKAAPSLGENGTVSCNFETSRSEAHDCRTNIPDSIRSSTNQNASLRNKGVAEDRQPSSNENRKNKRRPPISTVNAASSLREDGTDSCNFVPSSLPPNLRVLTKPVGLDLNKTQRKKSLNGDEIRNNLGSSSGTCGNLNPECHTQLTNRTESIRKSSVGSEPDLLPTNQTNTFNKPLLIAFRPVNHLKDVDERFVSYGLFRVLAENRHLQLTDHSSPSSSANSIVRLRKCSFRNPFASNNRVRIDSVRASAITQASDLTNYVPGFDEKGGADVVSESSTGKRAAKRKIKRRTKSKRFENGPENVADHPVNQYRYLDGPNDSSGDDDDAPKPTPKSARRQNKRKRETSKYSPLRVSYGSPTKSNLQAPLSRSSIPLTNQE